MNKYIKYLNYILKHKWYVLLECCKMGLFWRGIMHDISKLFPDEIVQYANFFYGDGRSLDVAWLKHQHRNKHHWQYWILKKDEGNIIALNMPKKYIKEMLCDWKGAGRAYKNTGDSWVETKEWYEKNKDNIILHDSTRNVVEDFLKLV